MGALVYLERPVSIHSGCSIAQIQLAPRCVARDETEAVNVIGRDDHRRITLERFNFERLLPYVAG
jgi:hypothetical protein